MVESGCIHRAIALDYHIINIGRHYEILFQIVALGPTVGEIKVYAFIHSFCEQHPILNMHSLQHHLPIAFVAISEYIRTEAANVVICPIQINVLQFVIDV